MRHIVLDQKKKNSKNILEKVILYILSGFFLKGTFQRDVRGVSSGTINGKAFL
jgi:hypothetical protein